MLGPVPYWVSKKETFQHKRSRKASDHRKLTLYLAETASKTSVFDHSYSLTQSIVSIIVCAFRNLPRFGHRQPPQTNMKSTHVRCPSANLLLTRSDDFLHIPKTDLQAKLIGHSFENLRDTRVGVGTEKRHPTMRLSYQDHVNHAADRRPRCQETLASGPASVYNLLKRPYIKELAESVATKRTS